MLIQGRSIPERHGTMTRCHPRRCKGRAQEGGRKIAIKVLFLDERPSPLCFGANRNNPHLGDPMMVDQSYPRRRLLVFTTFLLFSMGQLSAQSPAVATVVTAGHLLDPRTGNVLSPAAVLIEGDKIKEVGTPAKEQAPPGAKIVDLGNATLLPGLIDCHTHLLIEVVLPAEAERTRRYNGDNAPAQLLAIVESPSKRVLLGAKMAHEDLESGITTVRNVGHSGIDGDVALRDAINAGWLVGPRILASGRKLAQQEKNGYVQNLNPALSNAILQQEFLSFDGPDQARQAVQKNLLYAVDVIKVTVEDDTSVAEMKAIVEEAHRQNVKVAVHAVTHGSIQTAIDGGADSIEHGDEASDEQLKQMRNKGMFIDLTPTSYGDFFTRRYDATIAQSLTLLPERLGSDERTRQWYRDLAQQILKGAPLPDESSERYDRQYKGLVQRVLKSG